MEEILFPTTPVYNPDCQEEGKVLDVIKGVICDNLGVEVSDFERLGKGQNINYKVYERGSEEPLYLLRLICRKGYPSLPVLQECTRLLGTAGMNHTPLLYQDPSSRVVPYGYFVLPWIKGGDGQDHWGQEAASPWIEDCTALLKRIHTLHLPYFGYLADGPRYESIKAYYHHMDQVIDHSFGKVFLKERSIWDLDRYRITSSSFLPEVFGRVKELADQIQSPVESVLLHGDMFPNNMVYSQQGQVLIDWDETRAGWWVYEIARTLYYMPVQELLKRFLEAYGEVSESMVEILIGIKLEHVRQMLRQMMMAAFNTTDVEETRQRVRGFEKRIKARLQED